MKQGNVSIDTYRKFKKWDAGSSEEARKLSLLIQGLTTKAELCLLLWDHAQLATL